LSNAKILGPWGRYGRWISLALLVALALGLARLVWEEMQSSRRQAAWLSERARSQTFQLQPGPSPAIRFPADGPFDLRLGYHALPDLAGRLRRQGYAVTAQARSSPALLEWTDRGLYPTYREKTQAGLEVRDCRGMPLVSARYPERVYRQLQDVPPQVAAALLFIENHELFDPHPMRNPAIEWDRFGKALVDQALRRIDRSRAAAGGSTLATQIEKFRHSPGGRTNGARDKLRQMASASLRSYLDGENTLPRRRQILLDYLNTVPLSAQAGFGEVNGLGDGLWAWYGRDFGEVTGLLAAPLAGADFGEHRRNSLAFRAALLPRQALAFKQALSLLVAQRRPSYYLAAAQAPALRELTDSYLRVLAEAGVIAPALRDAALPLALQLQAQAAPEPAPSFVERKAATALRGHLQGLLGMPRAYDLDRLDLAVDSSLAGEVQQAATALLRSLSRTEAAQAAGLYGPHLLNPGDDTGKIAFGFTLFERFGGVNLLRAQTDNGDQPFDLNEGARLDLGSTAKLRTLVTYLEQVTALHGRWNGLDGIQLAALEIAPGDAIGRWARDHLAGSEDRGLPAMLAAAMERTYSANPGEGFYTGGGLHHFENFEPADNHRLLTVREAFTRSVNLVFIRLMRDVVHRVLAESAEANTALLDDPADPRRQQYLERFAEKEGREFIARFYRKFAGRPAAEAEDLLLQNLHPTPVRLASLYYGLEPEGDAQQLAAFLARRLPGAERSAPALHEKYRAGLWSLADRGYLAGVHPLELWVAGHLRRHPQATLAQTLAASHAERRAVYVWLFTTRHKGAQDVRIRSLLELEAFMEIQRAWQRLGYPFESLTPSYATALGASGDRPAALAELMGIVVNGGLRLPVARIDALHFATGTPYETQLAYRPPAPERVLSPEVAEVVRKALIDVVDNGTAKRLKGALQRSDGSAVAIGGKTGTGDHRFDTYGRGGQLISSRVVDRSATMVFMIGERYFGTLLAYVHEPDAANYRFTSALPAQLLKAMAPRLLPLIEGSACAPARAPAPAAQQAQR
jgi:membrane peptidoglycan carboxypeptidase